MKWRRQEQRTGSLVARRPGEAPRGPVVRRRALVPRRDTVPWCAPSFRARRRSGPQGAMPGPGGCGLFSRRPVRHGPPPLSVCGISGSSARTTSKRVAAAICCHAPSNTASFDCSEAFCETRRGGGPRSAGSGPFRGRRCPPADGTAGRRPEARPTRIATSGHGVAPKPLSAKASGKWISAKGMAVSRLPVTRPRRSISRRWTTPSRPAPPRGSPAGRRRSACSAGMTLPPWPTRPRADGTCRRRPR